MNTETTVTVETISEQFFWKKALLCVVGILLCLVMLCSTTLAWFEGNATSASKPLFTGHFALVITLVRLPDTEQDTAYAVEPTRINENNGTHYYNLSAGSYRMVITLDDTADAKGFCFVNIDGEQLITEAIIGESTTGKDGFALTSPYTFTLVVTSDDTPLSVRPHRGIHIAPTLLPDTSYTT